MSSAAAPSPTPPAADNPAAGDPAQGHPVGGAPSRWSRWWQWSDRMASDVSDRCNPILIKETRQALKSRQFVVTFSVLLFAALAWTVVGSLSMMPQIYTSPSAVRMLVGYYCVLAVPMLLVVPLAAYRSLENEIDDGTLELLSISTLSPWQIVLGKLASAMLQMLLYFVALFPCVAYAYTLRGVDLPTVTIMIATLMIVGVSLTMVALFFAPLALSRSGRIVTLLAVMSILVGAQFSVGTFVIDTITSGNRAVPIDVFVMGLVAASVMVAGGYVLLTATAAQLTPISENRSTAIRVSLLVFTAVMVSLAMAAYRISPDELGFIVPWGITMGLCVLWVAAGAMMIGETPVVTPRIRRELPSSLIARATLTFLTPGPVTGLALASVVGLVLVGGFEIWTRQVEAQPRLGIFPTRDFIWLRRTLWAAAAYAVGILTLAMWLMKLIRLRNSPRVEVGLAAVIAVMVVLALVPYSIGLHLNDYRQYDFTIAQGSNWAWAITEVSNGNLIAIRTTLAVAGAAAVGLLLTILSHPKLMFPRRIATPRRVLEQRRLDARGGADLDAMA